jgi:3-isopropylmalate/(R)-2-methylmalate dehydratase small subunit
MEQLMEPFTTLTAIAVPLDIAKIDTGMIAPGRFQRVRRRLPEVTYADVFLHDLRFDEQDRPRPEFVLNQPEYRGARILVTGPDFGCGSSRESAAYSVLDYGVRALIGASFGDVFAGNCMQNGIVPVVLPPDAIEHLWRQIRQTPGVAVTVDLVAQAVSAPDGRRYGFEIDATRKERLMKGLDDVGVTLEHLAEIETFEAAYASKMPWLASKM